MAFVPLPKFANSIFVDAAELHRRLSICEMCPLLTSFMGQKTCGRCGCFLDAKAKLRKQRCPDPNPKW